MSQSLNPEAILAELTEFSRRLAEAEEVIRVIGQGEANAQVISKPQEDEVYPQVHTPQQPSDFQQSLLNTIPSPVFYKNFEEQILRVATRLLLT